jgi:DNA (cytosine-5)-methyltransferase 1
MATFGSLFSGGGLMDSGFVLAGFDLRWNCEMDKDARRVLAKHHPGVHCFADVREVGKANAEAVDVIVGGFPCQSVSVAGKRAGISDMEKTGLFHEMVRVVDELQPHFLVWENVPGLLSSFTPLNLPPPDAPEGSEWEMDESSDFESVLSCLASIGFHGGWTSLDARYFGVPQRRLRIFGVFARVDIAADRCAEILALASRGKGDFAARRQAESHLAASLRSRSASSGVSRPGRGGEDDVNLAYSLPASSRGTGDGHGQGWNSNYQIGEVAHTPRGVGFDASEDGTGRGTPLVTAPSVSAGDRRASGNRGGEKLVAATLNSGADGSRGFRTEPGTHLVTPPLTSVPYADNIAHEDKLVVAAFGGNNTKGPIDIATALNACKSASGRQDFESETFIVGQEPIPIDMRQTSRGGTMTNVRAKGSSGGAPGTGIGEAGDPSPTIAASHTPAVAFQERGCMVRRLTPVECCRLMGVPDDYLDLDPPLSDGAKYRILGNGVVVPVAEWIAKGVFVHVNQLKRRKPKLAKQKYLIDNVRDGRYVRAWKEGKGRQAEIVVQIWNGETPEGEPDADLGLPAILGVETAVAQAMAQTLKE